MNRGGILVVKVEVEVEVKVEVKVCGEARLAMWRVACGVWRLGVI